jgi:hypothetical protein
MPLRVGSRADQPGNLYLLENARVLGLSELRARLIREKKPFDCDTPVDGVRALDRYTFFSLGYGPKKGQSNPSRFDLPAFNALYERQKQLPDGPERQALMSEAKKLMIAYMPYKVHVNRIFTDLAQPWVVGCHRNLFVAAFFKSIDVDLAEWRRRQGPAGAAASGAAP